MEPSQGPNPETEVATTSAQMQDDDVDGDGAVPQIYRDLHGGPMGTWYAKDGQMALRETHGPFPASAAGLESWAALEEITQAFHEHPDSATAPSNAGCGVANTCHNTNPHTNSSPNPDSATAPSNAG